MFQSLDWVDVDFDLAIVRLPLGIALFQSLDWVDVDFDIDYYFNSAQYCSFNPSTGLMLIST